MSVLRSVEELMDLDVCVDVEKGSTNKLFSYVILGPLVSSFMFVTHTKKTCVNYCFLLEHYL